MLGLSPPMDTSSIESFSKLMQISVSPVVLISAVALLMLSVTNRLGRAIDRARLVVRELELGVEESRGNDREQLRILVSRAGFLRFSVSLLVASIFLSCVMILFLFFRSFGGLRLEIAVIWTFFLNLLMLIGSMSFLLADVFLSLKALRIEVQDHTP